jgi:hypothetical protein
MPIAYNVYTNLNPEEITEIAVSVFKQWLEWSLGKGSLGGKTIMHPSGRYAASLSWRKTGVASVAIIADESIAKEALFFETGTVAHSMRDSMLGSRMTKRGADGYRYRVIPIRKDSASPGIGAALAAVVGGAKGQHMSKGFKKIWAAPVPYTNPGEYVTMSDKPGSSDWMVPAMPAYSPAAILASLIGKAATLYGS